MKQFNEPEKEYFFIFLVRWIIYAIIIGVFAVPLVKGQNKGDAAHFYASASISAASTELSYQMSNKPLRSALIGFSVGFGANLFKELVWDKRLGRGVYSKNDLLIGSFGAATGAIVISVKIDINSKKHKNEKQK